MLLRVTVDRSTEVRSAAAAYSFGGSGLRSSIESQRGALDGFIYRKKSDTEFMLDDGASRGP
jgi:hypothetical protein